MYDFTQQDAFTDTAVAGENHYDVFRHSDDAANQVIGDQFSSWALRGEADVRLAQGVKMWSNRPFYSDVDFDKIWTWLTNVELSSAQAPLDVFTELRGDERTSKSYCWVDHFQGEFCSLGNQYQDTHSDTPFSPNSNRCEIADNNYGFDEVGAGINDPYYAATDRCKCLDYQEGQNIATAPESSMYYTNAEQGREYIFRQLYTVVGNVTKKYGCGCSAFSSSAFPDPAGNDLLTYASEFDQCNCDEGFSGPNCLCHHGFWSGITNGCQCEDGWSGTTCNILNQTNVCATDEETLSASYYKGGSVLVGIYSSNVIAECNNDADTDNRCVAGACVCAEGWSPSNLDNPQDCKCPGGMTGPDCLTEICPSGPDGQCNGRGTCNEETGECECFSSTDDTEWTGGYMYGDACELSHCEQPCPLTSGLANCASSLDNKIITCACANGDLNLFCSSTLCPSPRFDAFTSATDDTDVCSSRPGFSCVDGNDRKECSSGGAASTNFFGYALEITGTDHCGSGTPCSGDGLCTLISDDANTAYSTGEYPHEFTTVAGHSITDPSEYYKCVCEPGRSGDECEIIPCASLNGGDDCPTFAVSAAVGGNEGICLIDDNELSSSTCDCEFLGLVEGDNAGANGLFRGDFCDIDVTAECGTPGSDESSIVECGFSYQETSEVLSRGTCVINATDTYCQCDNGYFGDKCQFQSCNCYRDQNNPNHGAIQCITDPQTQGSVCECIGDVYAPTVFNTTLEVCTDTCLDWYVPSADGNFCECPDPSLVNEVYTQDLGAGHILRHVLDIISVDLCIHG
jgi:hypothetical protein